MVVAVVAVVALLLAPGVARLAERLPIGGIDVRPPGAVPGARPAYGYDETVVALPGFDPLTGHFLNHSTHGIGSQVPTLSAGPGAPLGIYYVDNRSEFDELALANRTVRAIAPVLPLYQLFGYGTSLGGMLDNEFFLEYSYDQAVFFGTTSPFVSEFTVELVNLTSGEVQLWNTSSPIDGTNQQVNYVGNNTVIVLSSNCGIVAYDLATRQSWWAGSLGNEFGANSTCFEANNAYWIPQRGQLINVEAHNDTGDHLEQLDATYDAQGRVHFQLAGTLTIDTAVHYNWVNGIAYNASAGKIAFSAGFWGGRSVYTYVLAYGSDGVLSTQGEVRYTAYNATQSTGRMLGIQRYVYTSDYILGESYGPLSWTPGVQYLFDPWNGSVTQANRSLEAAPCDNSCFEGLYAPSPDYAIDFNATLQMNDPTYRVAYAFHGPLVPPSITAGHLSAAGTPHRSGLGAPSASPIPQSPSDLMLAAVSRSGPAR